MATTIRAGGVTVNVPQGASYTVTVNVGGVTINGVQQSAGYTYTHALARELNGAIVGSGDIDAAVDIMGSGALAQWASQWENKNRLTLNALTNLKQRGIL